MKLYNTLTRKKEEFVPIDENEVKIYACGPTVYNYIHIGNARPLCVFDVLRRYLEFKGHNVNFVQNFTDIDDKIINKAISENTDFLSVAKKYTEEYKKDAEGLGVRDATLHPKATENIGEIIKIISNLIEKGYAYALPNGDVYFKTRAFKNYGRLSNQTIDDLRAGSRGEIGELKSDPLDFALWKSAKPGEPFWESPWDNGRPGWHIECSAMAGRFLGKTIDIHCGGQDLIFPHHENEIAQSECSNGVKFANYWLHNGYINIDSQKMSKSLGNFFTVREIAEKYGYEAIRYLMISAHYRTPINYSDEVTIQCKTALKRLYNFKENVEFAIKNAEENTSEKKLIDLNVYRAKFMQAMDDDLNTADALAAIFELVRDANANVLSNPKADKSLLVEILNMLDEFAEILGILYENKKDIPKQDEIEELMQRREEARKNKDWALADKIRDELKARNIIIEDTPQGAKIVAK